MIYLNQFYYTVCFTLIISLSLAAGTRIIRGKIYKLFTIGTIIDFNSSWSYFIIYFIAFKQ